MSSEEHSNQRSLHPLTDPALLPATEGEKHKRMLLFLPLALLLALVVLLFFGFFLNDPHQLPSALLGEEIPEFSLGALNDAQRQITQEDLKGQVVLVNVWATWCTTCAAEHAELLRIQRETSLPIVGVVYKDDPVKARFWLAQRGDPYAFNILDRNGRLGVNLGVYGAPESFLLNREGIIVYKRVGDINRRVWRSEIEPELVKLGFVPQVGKPSESGVLEQSAGDF